MSERGILFSAPMVKALLDGTKTQTRRVVKAPKCALVHGRVSYPDKSHMDPGGMFSPKGEQYLHWAYGGGDHGSDVLKARVYSPYGSPAHTVVARNGKKEILQVEADRLWVRETWCAPGSFAKLRTGRVSYRADTKDGANPFGLAWKPSIYMPRWASRITLEITGVRCERLQSISEEDARAEGVNTMNIPARINGVLGTVHCFGHDAHRNAYRFLWEAINGKTAPWASDPWCWCISFRRVK